MVMKRILLAAVALVGFIVQANAQKIGYINTETILSQMSEYTVAQEKLNTLAAQYKDKVDAEFKVVEQMYNKYMSVKGSLSESQRAQQENAIIAKEKQAKELRNTYFGQDGYLQKKTEELMEPIKAKVQAAIDKIAKNEDFMIIFDLSTLQGVVYDNPQYDMSGKVLEVMDIK